MQAPAADDALIGVRLADKYRVLREIGRGGMGVVYEAEHVGLGKRVAVKLMLEKYTGDDDAIARFHREALAAGRIGNPHIIEIFDIGTAPDGRSFVVMELLSGFPLAKVLEMGGAMPPWRAIQIMRQVLRAVGAAHAKGIIHRDLKPDNIFLVNQSDDHDYVKLLDFGISKMVSLEDHASFAKLTTTGVVMGTPLYMAPEQALGNPIERASDIYACGVILYEMLAGHPPFDGPTYAALVAKLLTAAPPPLDELRPGLPPALVRAVHRALEKEPGDRYASAEAFAAALPAASTPSHFELAGTLDSGARIAAPPAATGGRTTRVGRMRNAAIAGVAFTVAAAATAVVLVVTDDAPAPAAQLRQDAAALALGSGTGSAPAAAPIATGTLEVKSKPSGAAVSIDGVRAGETPIAVTLEPGRHQVRVELTGYAPVVTDEDVRANERTSVPVTLVAAPGGTAAAPAEKTVAERAQPDRAPARPAPPGTAPAARAAPSAARRAPLPSVAPASTAATPPAARQPPAATQPTATQPAPRQPPATTQPTATQPAPRQPPATQPAPAQPAAAPPAAPTATPAPTAPPRPRPGTKPNPY